MGAAGGIGQVNFGAELIRGGATLKSRCHSDWVLCGPGAGREAPFFTARKNAKLSPRQQ
jgi:hypothetical protein